MKSATIYQAGLIIDLVLLLLLISNLLFFTNQWNNSGALEGMTSTGRMLLWIFPGLLSLIITVGYFLNKAGHTLAAKIILWLPALPFAAAAVMWILLAVLFIAGAIFK